MMDALLKRIGTIDLETGERVRIRRVQLNDKHHTHEIVERKDRRNGKWRRDRDVEGSER